MTTESSGAALREDLERAIEEDRPKDVVAALEALEGAEPRDARWPQRLGDALRFMGRTKDAALAYERAVDGYTAQGFLPRAIAMAKLVVDLDPTRADLLQRLDSDAMRELVAQFPPALRRAKQSVSPPAQIGGASNAESAAGEGMRIAGAPLANVGVVAASAPLTRAPDAAGDEVRFEDSMVHQSFELDLSEFEAITGGDEVDEGDARDAEATADSQQGPSAQRLAAMSAAKLLASLPPYLLVLLARAAELVELKPGGVLFRAGDPADALYVVVEGVARVEIPSLEGGGLELFEGQLFGEACLLEAGLRAGDVRATTDVRLLKIARERLVELVVLHLPLADVLFDLLLQRLVGDALRTSPFFAPFDPETRVAIGKLFEVRRAWGGVELAKKGKRTDGLYVTLAGKIEIEDDAGQRLLPLGATFGHESLAAGGAASRCSVRTLRGDAVVLRLPAAQFTAFAAAFPEPFAEVAQAVARAAG